MDFRDARVLVTGGAGFVGSNARASIQCWDRRWDNDQ
jgi:nucleoside-diphosphate-sugar epimerase